MTSIQNQLKVLPTTPGVYRYFNSGGRLLYIGKATNLQRRVTSYFTRPQEPRIAKLVSEINRIETTPTETAIEALFLEGYLISSYQPPYNVDRKDDKTFVLVVITKEDFPRVVVTHLSNAAKLPILYQFGPYTSTRLVRTALGIIRKILPFRTRCRVKKVARGCLDYQICLCPGPCAHVINRAHYRQRIRQLVYFLKGNKQRLIRELRLAMRRNARKQHFEEAARIRNQLEALGHIHDIALITQDYEENHGQTDHLPQRIEAYDISNLREKSAVASMVVVTSGRPDTAHYRTFRIKTVLGQHDLAMMEEVLTRRLLHRDWPTPDLIVLDGGDEHLKIGSRVLKKLRLTIPMFAASKGPERKKLDLYPSHDNPYPTSSELIRRIRLARDEAHRFAIRYHRTRRIKDFLVN